MTPRAVFLALALVCAAATSATAQSSTTAPNAGRREQAQERRDAMRARREARAAMSPDQRRAARATRQARLDAMPPEQQQYMRDLRSYRQGLRSRSTELQAQVNAGTISRDAMAHELKQYRDANRPSRPAGMPEPARRP